MPAPASSQPVSHDSQRPAEPQPAILLVSALHGDVLTRQFRRYVREYDVRAVDSQASLSAALEQLEEDADGWYRLGTVGQRLQNLSPEFDTRTFGQSKLSDLVEATGRFEVGREGGQVRLRRKPKRRRKA